MLSSPLIGLGRSVPPPAQVWVKTENLLPSGSVYDRIAEARVAGAPSKDGPLVVAGSGSLCLAFAAAANRAKKPITVVCPASTLPEHVILLRKHKLRVVLSDPAHGLMGTHEEAVAVQRAEGGQIVHTPKQAKKSREVFRDTLGHELGRACKGLDPVPELLVAPVGSGGLLTGVLEGVRSQGVDVRALGTVVPDDEGQSVQDGVVWRRQAPASEASLEAVSDESALACRGALAKREGLLVGVGSAAAIHAALSAVKRGDARAAVVIVVDAGDRYFSVDARAVAGRSG